MKVKAKIGITYKERRTFQNLLITLNYSYNLKKNQDPNKIDNLVDYSTMIIFIKNFVRNSRYHTLEKLITEFSIVLKREFHLTNINLKIDKPLVAKKYGSQDLSVSK